MRDQTCPRCGQDMRLPPDAFEQLKAAKEREEVWPEAVAWIRRRYPEMLPASEPPAEEGT